MKNCKTINYKVLSETDRIEAVENQEQQETEEVAEISTLLRNISISEELQHLHQEDNMEKQRTHSLKVDGFTSAEDIADYTDENDVSDSGTMEETDGKISRVEQLRASYRRLHNQLKIALQDRYAEEYEEGYKKKLQTMKNYIKNVQALKKDMSERRSKVDIKHKASRLRSELFLGQEMKSSIAHLEEVFRVHAKVMKDDEITTTKADVPKELKDNAKKNDARYIEE